MNPAPEQRRLEPGEEITVSLVDDFRLVEVHAMRSIRHDDVIGLCFFTLPDVGVSNMRFVKVFLKGAW